ncbi:MAG: hypothetical protein J5714_03405 [Alphaproteobacteria bacterium]|nr:hypothetical protein [Alphaproteobacteria bacterium]
MFNSATITTGYRLTDTGTTTADPNGFYTAHIPVIAGSTYTYKQNTGSSIILRICEYDSSNTLTKLNKYGSGGTQTQTITMQANTSYVIISSDKRFVSNPPQFEQGSTATDYTPYGQVCTDD